MIQIERLRHRYRRSGPWVLDGIDLHVPQGSLFGLLGPNGAGKSTLIHALLGLNRTRPGNRGGAVRVAGLPMPGGRAAVARRTGLAPQALAFYPSLTVAENLDFFAVMGGTGGAARIERCVDIAQIGGYLENRAETLSGGLQRRLNLAIALLNKPRLLILDEPTVGVDPQSRGFILQALKRLNAEGATILYTTHYMEEVEQLCDRVAILDAGRLLASGPLDELLRGGASLQVAFAPTPSAEQRRALLAGLDGEWHDAGLWLHTDDPLASLAMLRGRLRGSELRIASLDYGRRRLQDLFFELTGHHLRDA